MVWTNIKNNKPCLSITASLAVTSCGASVVKAVGSAIDALTGMKFGLNGKSNFIKQRFFVNDQNTCYTMNSINCLLSDSSPNTRAFGSMRKIKVKVGELSDDTLKAIAEMSLLKCRKAYASFPAATKVWIALKTGVTMTFIVNNWEKIIK